MSDSAKHEGDVLSMTSHKNGKILEKTNLKDYLSNLVKNQLNISEADIVAIEVNAFECFPNLEYLSLSHNMIDFIHISAFAKLSNLRKLIISFNALTTLENKGFQTLENLEELEITDNKIRLIYPRAFYGLKKLKRLILANNEINTIYPETFDGLTELNLLILSYNKLKGLHTDTFKELKNLKTLNLMKNQLKAIPETIFKNCPKLSQITLSRNKISHLHSSIFRYCEGLERLFCHTNKLKYVESDLFKGLKCLKVLDLGNNKIKWVEENSLDGLTDLEVLDLSLNRLQLLDGEVFVDLKKVSVIYLNNNSIHDINNVKMCSLKNMQTIHLDFNHIIHLEPELFKKCESLLEVYCNTISTKSMKLIQNNLIEHNRQLFLDSITFICSFTEPEFLLNSVEACQKLDYISYFSNQQKLVLFQSISESEQNILIKNVTESIGYLSKDYDIHINKYRPFRYESDKMAFKVLELLTTIVKNWSVSQSFCVTFAKYGGIDLILAFIDSSLLKTKIPVLEQTQSKYSFKIAATTYSNCLSIIFNLVTKTDNELKKLVINKNAFDILIRVSESFENISDFRLKSYMCIGNIFIDKLILRFIKEVSQLAHIKSVLAELISYTGECSAEINNKNLERFPINFDEVPKKTTSDSFKKETMIIQINESFFYLTDFFDVLYHYAVSDEIKFDIYETYSMKKQLKMIILYGNLIEKEHGLKLLWQCCYDQRVANHLLNDNTLLDLIKELAANQSENENLTKNAKGLLWLLSKDQQIGTRCESKLDEDSEITEKHIMISYNSKSRDICLRLKEVIENQGYKVWIDVEQIYGSSLEAMASAIENSLCVLLCVTKKYKESNFCRLEAEYTLQQKKPFIPLIMEQGYKPDGWLGIIIGAKIYVDFTKLSFEIASSEVLRNLQLTLNKNSPKVNRSTNNSSNLKSSSLGQHSRNFMKSVIENLTVQKTLEEPDEVNWTDDQVEEWFEKMNIDHKIVENLTPCNGQVMYQLYNMLHFNPEFFYGSLKPITGNSLKDLKNIAIFCLELKALFDVKY